MPVVSVSIRRHTGCSLRSISSHSSSSSSSSASSSNSSLFLLTRSHGPRFAPGPNTTPSPTKQPFATLLPSPIVTRAPTILCSITVLSPITVSSKTYACETTTFSPIVHRWPITDAVMVAPEAIVVWEPMSVLVPILLVLERTTVLSLGIYLFPRRCSYECPPG